MTEFVEYLFEFNVLDRAPKSIATWAKGKFDKIPGWMEDGFSSAGITLTADSVFEITGSDDNAIQIGDGDTTLVYTNVYSGPPAEGGTLLGVAAWRTNPSKYFKELKVGNSIEWGRNTDALETAQCLGVYLSDVDTILNDLANPGEARAKWQEKIKGILGS